MTGDTCPLIEEADVVVFALPLDDPAACRLLATHPALHPGTAFCVEPRHLGSVPRATEHLSAAAVRLDPHDPDAAGVVLRSIADDRTGPPPAARTRQGRSSP